MSMENKQQQKEMKMLWNELGWRVWNTEEEWKEEKMLKPQDKYEVQGSGERFFWERERTCWLFLKIKENQQERKKTRKKKNRINILVSKSFSGTPTTDGIFAHSST